MTAERIVIIDAKRTPLARSVGDKIPIEEGGDNIKKAPSTYANVSGDELLAVVIKGLMAKNPKVDPTLIEDVSAGCVMQYTDQGINVAKNAILMAGLPENIPAETVNRNCASSLSSLGSIVARLYAMSMFKDGQSPVGIACGTEHLGRHPMINNSTLNPSSAFYTDFLAEKDNIRTISMGLTAEKLARIYKISREQQAEFSYLSQTKAVAAQESGKFDEEIIPVPSNGTMIDKDVGPRTYASKEAAMKLYARLPTVFQKGGSVTAATSSVISDGASAAIVTTESYAKEAGLTPMASVVGFASVGVDPTIMGWGPVPSTALALKRAGITLDDVGLIELNEAFAAQALAVIEHGWGIKMGTKEFDRINVNGGAVALGHPLGCTGVRLVSTLLHEMKRRTDVRYGLTTLCVGGGMGYAMVFEKWDG